MKPRFYNQASCSFRRVYQQPPGSAAAFCETALPGVVQYSRDTKPLTAAPICGGFPLGQNGSAAQDQHERHSSRLISPLWSCAASSSSLGASAPTSALIRERSKGSVCDTRGRQLADRKADALIRRPGAL
ncbi:hypothetical protein GN956_G656 [Arapaima gigas]